MKCVLVLIAGVFINPCTVASMNPYPYDKNSCVIWHNSGDAWTGQHKTIVETKCEIVAKELKK